MRRILHAHVEHIQRERRLFAQLGHWVFVAWRGTKDSPTPEQLLGEERLSPEAAEATLNEIVTGEPASVAEFDRFMKAQRGPDT